MSAAREQPDTRCMVLTSKLQVQGDVLVLYVYQLKAGPDGSENVAVEKVSFRRSSGLAPSTNQ